MTIPNTFSAGVNTSFSSQLNTNFDYARVIKKKYGPFSFIQICGKITPASTDCVVIDYATSIKANSTAIQKSTDHGSTWTTKKTAGFTPTYFNVSAANSNYIVAYDGVQGGEYSTNGGESWTAITPPSTTSNVVYAISNSGRLFALSRNSGTGVHNLDYSDNSGSSWSSKSASVRTGSWGTSYVRAATDNIFGYMCYISVSSAQCGVTDDGTTFVTDTASSSALAGIVQCAYYDDNNYQICAFVRYSAATAVKSKLNGTAGAIGMSWANGASQTGLGFCFDEYGYYNFRHTQDSNNNPNRYTYRLITSENSNSVLPNMLPVDGSSAVANNPELMIYQYSKTPSGQPLLYTSVSSFTYFSGNTVFYMMSWSLW